MTQKLLKTTIALMLLFGLQVRANDLLITNVSMAGINTTDHFIMVQFDINWENSWRTSSAPNNWDAAWIFVKYRVNNGEWLHASLSATNGDHIAPSGSIIDAGSDGMGVFIYRDTDGTGTNNWTNTQLRWNYSVNSVDDATTNVEIQVIGIEMVYVPQGAFYAGDNATSDYSFKQGSADDDPWYIGSEDTINVTNSAGTGTGLGTTNAEFYYVSGSSSGEDVTGAEFNIPTAFPKGYNAFYCMKYEITQGQYTEFLNMLTRSQQTKRVGTNIYNDAVTNIYAMSNTFSILNRNAIVCPATGNGTTNPIVFSTITPEIACNDLSWGDGIAYADWAGLRPMTELEFEKACRGTLTAISGEYAWGSAVITTATYTLSDAGTTSEGIASNYWTSGGNATYLSTNGAITGPTRVGIFTANAGNTGRITSGAGYSGIMELSGNLHEKVVSAGNSTGRTFTGTNGNGALNASGHADVAYWPGNTAVDSGIRGGSWATNSIYLRSSIRTNAAVAAENRGYSGCFRAVRLL